MEPVARWAVTSWRVMPSRSMRVPSVVGRVSAMADRLAPVTPTQPAAAQPDRPRLLLVDGHSMAYRAYFALPVENFATSSGEPTNAVFGFTSMLTNLLRDEKPTHLAVAFDVGRVTFRTERYGEYKAT